MDTIGTAGKGIIVLIVKRVELIEILVVQDCFQLCVHTYDVDCAKVIVLISKEFKSKRIL